MTRKLPVLSTGSSSASIPGRSGNGSGNPWSRRSGTSATTDTTDGTETGRLHVGGVRRHGHRDRQGTRPAHQRRRRRSSAWNCSAGAAPAKVSPSRCLASSGSCRQRSSSSLCRSCGRCARETASRRILSICSSRSRRWPSSPRCGGRSWRTRCPVSSVFRTAIRRRGAQSP